MFIQYIFTHVTPGHPNKIIFLCFKNSGGSTCTLWCITFVVDKLHVLQCKIPLHVYCYQIESEILPLLRGQMNTTIAHWGVSIGISAVARPLAGGLNLQGSFNFKPYFSCWNYFPSDFIAPSGSTWRRLQYKVLFVKTVFDRLDWPWCRWGGILHSRSCWPEDVCARAEPEKTVNMQSKKTALQ